jgi:diguanylate cyclase (GGDEF)-like protein
MNVLVVDDHRLFRDGLLTVLKRLDDVELILEASDGAEAEKLIENEDIDLALIDFHLPDTTGPMLLRQLKVLAPEIPVIIMSGSEDPAMIRSAMGEGSSGFLPKTMEPDELIDAINVVLSGEIYVPLGMLNKLETNELDLTNAKGVDYSDLIQMAKVTQQVISTSDWSIRAKREASSRPEAIEAFNQLLDKMENHYNELRQHAFHDALTGLPNRRLFNDRLEQALYHASRKNKLLSLVALDIDKFKKINDDLGHDKGDELLKIIASKLMASTRQIDTVSRLGGDEFMVVLTEVADVKAVEMVVKKIFSALTEPLMLGGYEMSPSVSVGVSLSDGSLDAEALFKRADEALYYVKRNGRNNYRISEC